MKPCTCVKCAEGDRNSVEFKRQDGWEWKSQGSRNLEREHFAVFSSKLSSRKISNMEGITRGSGLNCM